MDKKVFLSSRRAILFSLLLGIWGLISAPKIVFAASKAADEEWDLPEEDWKKRLSLEAYSVLRKEGTERPFTSPLNEEKRKGIFHCAGCNQALFDSSKKFDSGTGWPSFWEPLPNAVSTKTDFKLIVPRTEYHCRQCGGHQGHVFSDGPRPTGKRYCNNGIALVFRPVN